MNFNELTFKLFSEKDNGRILDYLIESEFAVREGITFVKTRLTIFSVQGKPTVSTGLVQAKSSESSIELLQQRSLEIAYNLNPLT